MSVEKQLKATSGYGMLAAVIAALLAIVGLFIWSLAGIAGTPDGVDAPAVYGWGLGLSIVAFCFWFLPLNGFFSLQPGKLACASSLASTWAPCATRASSGQTRSLAGAWA